MGSSAEPNSDSIPPRSDEEAGSAYYGGDFPRAASGGNGDGLRREGVGGGGGGDGDGDGDGGGGQAPGTGGVRELVNHPVLFSVDADVLRAILESS